MPATRSGLKVTQIEIKEKDVKPGETQKKRDLRSKSVIVTPTAKMSMNRTITIDGKKSETKKTAPTPKNRSLRSKKAEEEEEEEMEFTSRSLRRRDQLKTTERYSPEAYEPPKRGRKGQISFPSTSASSSKYISFDSDDDVNNTGVSPPKRKKVVELGSKKEVRSYIVDVKKDEESNKMVIMLPDGTTYKVDATPEIGSSVKRPMKRNRRRPLDEDFEEYLEDDDTADGDPEDIEYKPSLRRKSASVKKEENVPSIVETVKSGQLKPTTATGIRIPKTVRIRQQPSTPTKVVITPKSVTSTEGTTTTKITTPSSTAGKTKVTFITTPKSVTVTATNTSFKQPPKRNYGSGAKFIDELPDLSECTTEENDLQMNKLPDKVLLINSDLPLKHVLSLENESNLYLFRQVISPVMSGFPCLLCNSKLFFKEEKDLTSHYSTTHELTSESSSAKFSEDIVFVCLPKAVIIQMLESTNSTVILNAPCQYCGDDVRLTTVEDMKTHYSEIHGKDIELIEQEEILNMHKALYCCVCSEQSEDFTAHHNHMKTVHKMQTLVCKRCLFTTQDATRLKTHYKAKHMISNKMQNLQCCYCNGLVTGVERMNKHIMTSHCVQTGVNEYSCTSCLQPCGKSDELLAHSYRCPVIGTQTNDNQKAKAEVDEAPMKNGERTPKKCFLCDKVFESEEKCNLHLNHMHTKWLSRSVLHDTFLMVRHPNGKTDIMPKPQGDSSNDSSILKLADLAPVKDLEEIGEKSSFGHYCFKCETVIKLYPLYYLHMYNVHKLGKMFECKVTACKQTFKEAKQLEDHIKSSHHPQKSVIEEPLSALACHYCDAYFTNEKSLEEHHLSDEHFNKINLLIDRSGNKPEPRNHKCKTCHTWFGLQDSFIYHMENESHKHGCPYCGLHFALPSSRRTHIQSHHNEKADVCELCSVKQGSKERLFAHLVEHNIVFECNRCMRKFYQREQLNAHMETHGEPVDCKWDNCGKKINRSALSSHIRQHRIENDSKCHTCGKSFGNRQLLSLHMEVHAKAETNAKAILSTVASTPGSQTIMLKGTNTPTIQGLLSEVPSGGTTLISITTPPSNLSALKPKSNPRSYTSRTNRHKPKPLLSPRSSNSIPQGLRIMCCSCNQIFNSHNELSNHKCVVPVVTITGPNDASIAGGDNSTLVIPSNQLIQEQNNSLRNDTLIITTGNVKSEIMRDETTSDNLEEDPEKLVLDLAAQLTQAVQAEEAEKLKQKQLQKVEQLVIQQQQRQSTPVTTGINRSRRTYSNLKNQIKDDVVKSNENPIQEIRTGKELADAQQLIAFEGQNELESKPLDESVNTGEDQCIVIQQPDGQLIQLSVPAGMDLEEVLRSLNFAWSGNEMVGDAETLPQQEQAVDEQSAVLAESEAAVDSDQQVIYLPVNDDGTCAIDAAALAMLTGSGEVPIIVTSSN
ncbi:uncharacterized protein B4U80_00947 [Leptotrombidium deliense]|uniref:C2H2-type domain-containing protein n=1 Tax=Leptotrombidium deliense TaxID=299467 RepID=A0A443SJY7_9ACAR|nr:uncharacterized protein B4U80_00947 [Leptotrombidium deliense]